MRDDKICVVKTPKDFGVYIYKTHFHTLDPKFSTAKNLEKCIEKLPKGFFELSEVSICIPFHQTIKNQVNFPFLSSEDLSAAISNLIDKDVEEGEEQRLCQYQKDGRPHLSLTIHKVKKEIIESYISVFEKHDITLKTATTESMVMSDLAKSRVLSTGVSPILVADLDFNALKLYVFLDHQLVYTRFVPLGFRNFLEAVTRKIVIEKKVTELTDKQGRSLLGSTYMFKSRKATDKVPYDRLFFQLRPIAEKVALEIKKTINFYIKLTGSESIKTLHTMGEFNNLFQFNTFLKENIDLKLTKAVFKGGYNVPAKKNDVGYRETTYFSLGTTKRLTNFNLLPQSYKEHQQSKKIAKIILVVMVFWMFVMAGAVFKFKKQKFAINQNLSQRKNEIKILELKVSQLSNLKTARFSVSKDIDFVNSILQSKVPFDRMVFDLSESSVPPIILRSISIGKDAIVLTGDIPSKRAQMSLIKYISKLEALPYIKSVVFDTKMENVDFISFELYGYLK